MNKSKINNIKNLGYLKDLDVFFKLVNWDGLRVFDIGCGKGDLSIALASKGAFVTGLESDLIQAEKNDKYPKINNLQFVYGSANSIPSRDQSLDCVIFSKSLHHVPLKFMDASLFEAIRVLNNNTGFLFILEPDTCGSFYELIKPFHDETLVRGKALESLDRVAKNNFGKLDEYIFTSKYIFKDFNSFFYKMSKTTFNKINEKDICSNKVKKMFDNGIIFNNHFSFENRMIVRIYSN